MNTSKAEFFPKRGLEVNISRIIIRSSYLEINWYSAASVRSTLLIRQNMGRCCIVIGPLTSRDNGGQSEQAVAGSHGQGKLIA